MQEHLYKNIHYSLNVLLATLPDEMQMFENDTNCAEITIKSYHVKFHTSSISYYSAAALLAMQSTVIPPAIPSVTRWYSIIYPDE